MKTIKELYEQEADDVATKLLSDASKHENLEISGEDYWLVHKIIKNLIISFYEKTT